MRRFRRSRPKRGFKKRALKKLQGVSKGCKSTLVLDTTPTDGSTKTMYTQLLTNLTRDGGNLDNRREQSDVWLSGFRLRATFRNNLASPIWFNMALINPKDAFPTDDLATNVPFSLEFFFSSLGQTTQLGKTPSTQMNGMDWGTLPINSSRHNVIWHFRKSLGVKPAAVGGPYTSGVGAPNYTKISRYIRINKKIQFVSTEGSSCRQPIFLIYWCSAYEEGTEEVKTNALITQFQIVTYFRDVTR